MTYWGMVFVSLLVMIAVSAVADLQPAAPFTDNAVLQQRVPVPVWGTGDDGETVTVSFQQQRVSTVVRDGQWHVQLKPLRAGGPFEMTIHSGQKVVRLKNILVGEVWLCSGQSNMQMALAQTLNGMETAAAAADPKLRLFTVPPRASMRRQTRIDGQWAECTPTTAAAFSAVAYYFGRDLRKALNVPVGLINSSFGGTVVQAWTSGQFLTGAAAHNRKIRELLRDNQYGDWLIQANLSSRLYNAMIYPLIPYALRGVIWYQGESNWYDAWAYRHNLESLIRNWRSDWGQGDFPFLQVQLAPYTAPLAEPAESNWAELRESQWVVSQRLPNVGMAVITDCGDADDIHPPYKEPVGQRLALQARAMAYGHKVVCQGPLYDSHSVVGDHVIIRFKHTHGGLVARGGPLTGWSIAGEDRRFVWADARIEDDTVVVSSPYVHQPVAVRFGWANYPVVNLYNGAGLPASPFRTDDFPVLTSPR